MNSDKTTQEIAEHAAAILAALEGDFHEAIEQIYVIRDQYGENYARRLAAYLMRL
jgi:hypothetical protein